MQGVLLTVAYDGDEFVGWAKQKNGRSVEETLEQSVRTIDPDASTLRGASRTDAGVHADAQMVAFDSTRTIDPRGWVLALNSGLPDDLAVRQARPIRSTYNPRFTSRAKRYRYRVFTEEVRDPNARHRSWRVAWPLDLARMNREAALLVGPHDFKAFRSVNDQRIETKRTLFRVEIERDDGALNGRILSVVVEGDAFLHNMVRIIVGTLVDVGRGHLPEGTVTKAFESGDRTILGPTAPAGGLTLEAMELELGEGAGEPWPP
jgi:tRNA pseudouridine38-40 synthase